MIQIEQLSLQLMNSPFFQQMLKNQVQQYTQKLSNNNTCESDSQRLPDLITEINGYLIQITESALEEENSHNYIAFMNKTQEMCHELSRKIEAKLERKIDALSFQIQKLELKLNETNKNPKKISLQSSKLQDERKLITEHILESSRNIGKSQSNINLRKDKSAVNINNHQQILNTNDSGIDYSIKLVEMEDNSRQIINQLRKNMQKSIQKLTKQYIQLEKRHATLKQSMEAGLSTNLEGVWNVLSDLSTRIIKCQSLKQSIPIYRK